MHEIWIFCFSRLPPLSLATHFRFTEAGSPTLGSSRSWQPMELEIQSLIRKLLDINDSMSICAAFALETASITQKLARHRDILHDSTQEFRRIKRNIHSMREHAELLSSVRDDISEYKASGSMSRKVQLPRERASIHGSISHVEVSDLTDEVTRLQNMLEELKGIPGDIKKTVKDDPIDAERREKVKEAMLHAWTSYEKYAWGFDELQDQRMGFDTLLKFINELSGHIDLDSTLRDAEALFSFAGEDGAARITPGTPPSLPIDSCSFYQQDDIL